MDVDEELTKLCRIHSTVCIPRVDVKITKQYIFGIFCALKVGFIERITEVPSRNSEDYRKILIKIKWNKNERTKYIMDRFTNGQNIKLVYSDPWYWICVSTYRPEIQQPPNPPPLLLDENVV